MRRRIGVIGVGLVGGALVERFLSAGYSVAVYDINEDRVREAAAKGAEKVHTPRQILSTCSRLVLSLPSSDEVEDVLEGENGILSGSPLPGVVIDTTTSDPLRCIEIGNLASTQGVPVVDATLSGSSQQVREGQAIVMVGGDASVIEMHEDLLKIMGHKIFTLGGRGAGSRAKLLVNLVLGLNRLALAEGIALAERTGMDAWVFLDLLKNSAAYSKVMETKGPFMIKREFIPQARLRQHHKDVRVILEMAKREGLTLPVSELHEELLSMAEDLGCGEKDNAAIIQVFRNLM